MKAYTNREQSKRLSEILPIDSADMCWVTDEIEPFWGIVEVKSEPDDDFEVIPAWSLSALLSVLPFQLIVDNQRYAFSMIKGLDKNGETYAIKYAIFNTTFYFHLTDFYNNPIDACYEMIIKLYKEMKLKNL